MTCLCVTFQSFGQILSGYLTPLIAIIVGYIAYQQYLLAKRKIRLDLFEKRFRVFIETKNILGLFLRDARLDNNDIRKFNLNCAERKFIFKSDINEYIDKILKEALLISNRTDYIQKNKVDNEYFSKAANEANEYMDWIIKELDIIEIRFKKYLDFRNL